MLSKLVVQRVLWRMQSQKFVGICLLRQQLLPDQKMTSSTENANSRTKQYAAIFSNGKPVKHLLLFLHMVSTEKTRMLCQVSPFHLQIYLDWCLRTSSGVSML